MAAVCVWCWEWFCDLAVSWLSFLVLWVKCLGVDGGKMAFLKSRLRS